MDDSIDLMSFLSPEARISLVQGLSFGATGPHWTQVFQPGSPRSPRLPSEGDQWSGHEYEDDDSKDCRFEPSPLHKSHGQFARHSDNGVQNHKGPLGDTCTGDVVWEWSKYIDATLQNFSFQNLINLHFACDSYIWMMSPTNETSGREPGSSTRSLLRRLMKLGTASPQMSTSERKSKNERKRSKRRNPKGLSKTK